MKCLLIETANYSNHEQTQSVLDTDARTQVHSLLTLVYAIYLLRAFAIFVALFAAYISLLLNRRNLCKRIRSHILLDVKIRNFTKATRDNIDLATDITRRSPLFRKPSMSTRIAKRLSRLLVDFVYEVEDKSEET